MFEPVFIVAIDNELDKSAFVGLILSKFSNVQIIDAWNLHEVHKQLFVYEDAAVIINSHYFESDSIQQSLALTLCFQKSKWLIFCNEIPDEVFISELLHANKTLNVILHSDGLNTISDALIATLHSRSFITDDVLLILEDLKKRKKEGVNKKNLLTSTEKEIIQLIIQGKTAKEIADLRCLSYHTVNTHRKNIFRKLEINSVQELIKYALKVGIMDLTEYYI